MDDKMTLGSRIRHPDALVAVLGALSLLCLGPLRDAFEAYPAVLYLSALFLFMVPGMVLSRRFLDEQFEGVAAVPVAFVLSSGLFAAVGVPMLIVHGSLAAYVWMAGTIVAFFLMTAVVGMIQGRNYSSDDAPAGTPMTLLWVSFLGLGAALAHASRLREPTSYDDMWIYLSYMREFIGAERLALYEPYFGRETGVSRVRINAWLLEQAAMSRISGIDPIALVLDYLAPTLVIVALLAVYALARVLFKSGMAGLLAGCLCALFYLVNLDKSLLSFGGEFVGRMAEDKFAARHIFLPVALGLAFAYVDGKKTRYLALFAFVCWTVMAVHPVGLAIIGLSMAGFGLVYVGLNYREREMWEKMVWLGTVLLSAVVIPAILVFLATGESFTAVLKDADINSNDPDVLANMVFVRPERERILELDDNSYIMHPSLLMDPVIMGAYLLGIPFLLRRIGKSLAAQLLLGMLLLVTIVCYVPPVATFMGDRVVVPGQLWRLAWPIPLAALLIVSWMAWEATKRLESNLRKAGLTRRVGGFLPLVLVGALIWVALPAVLKGVEDVDGSQAASQRSCFDPVFSWMRENINEPSVVLAPDSENTCIPAYSASTNVVSLRAASVLGVLSALQERVPGQIEVPRGAVDVMELFSEPSAEENVRIIQRYRADYVLVPRTADRGVDLADVPGIEALETPGQGYDLYLVDQRKLGEGEDIYEGR